MNELISIIIPVYNVEKYLSRCLDSIVQQTYVNLEVILIDDGSPDKSGMICDEYAEKYEHFVVIHKKNEGVSRARNDGLDICKGKYVAFIDSDDYIANDYIEILYKNIVGVDAVVCNFNVVSTQKSSNLKYFTIDKDVILIGRDKILNECANTRIYTSVVWAKLFRKELTDQVRFINQNYSEDAIFTRQSLFYAHSIKLINYNGYNYFIEGQGVTSDRKRAAEAAYGLLNANYKTWQMCDAFDCNVDYEAIEYKVGLAWMSLIYERIRSNKKLNIKEKELADKCYGIVKRQKPTLKIKLMMFAYGVLKQLKLL